VYTAQIWGNKWLPRPTSYLNFISNIAWFFEYVIELNNLFRFNLSIFQMNSNIFTNCSINVSLLI
jgi:hypothetical protein